MPSGTPFPAVRAEAVFPAYLFSGEDLYPARGFLRELRAALAGPGGEEAQVETFDLKIHRWRDIVDAARSLPLIFSPWRIFAVEAEGAAGESLSKAEIEAFGDYFAGPVERTTIIILFAGRIHKTKSLARMFAALPKEAAFVLEIAPLKGSELSAYAKKTLSSLGKRASEDAIRALLETAGNDLARLDGEIEKAAAFAGAKSSIEADDVAAVSGGGRGAHTWDLTDALEMGDRSRAFIALHRLLEDDAEPLYLMAVLAGFFRDVLIARAGIRDGRDRREIFREIKPQISEKFGPFHQKKMGQFFACVERIPEAEARRLILRLERMDLLMKSTDTSPRAMIEAFLGEAAGRPEKARLTFPGRA